MMKYFCFFVWYNIFVMKKNKGFTLVELLIAIGIIGILTAIALVSLSNARMAAKDAAVRQALNNYRTQIEIEYDGNYNGLCTTGNPSLNNIEEFINSQGGSLYSCNSDTNDYVIVATLPSGVDEEVAYSTAEYAYAEMEHDALCINSRGNLLPINLSEYKELPKKIDLRIPEEGEVLEGIELSLNPFCSLNQQESYFNGGQNGTSYARVCYDLKNPEFTKTGCVDVLEKTPVEPVVCDKAGIKPIEGCTEDYPSERVYKNVCKNDKYEVYSTGCVEEIQEKTGTVLKPTDPVFCKGLEPVDEKMCEQTAKYQAVCPTGKEPYTTGCIAIDKAEKPLYSVDASVCTADGVEEPKDCQPVDEPCSDDPYEARLCEASENGFVAHCINEKYQTGCVAIDQKTGVIEGPVNPDVCKKEGIEPSQKTCKVTSEPYVFSSRCIDKEFSTGCVVYEKAKDTTYPVDVNECLERGIKPSKEECAGSFNYVCVGKEPPYQTGCVENKDGKLFQVDPKLCEEAKATPATCK